MSGQCCCRLGRVVSAPFALTRPGTADAGCAARHQVHDRVRDSSADAGLDDAEVSGFYRDVRLSGPPAPEADLDVPGAGVDVQEADVRGA
jgi:hypothetical protein